MIFFQISKSPVEFLVCPSQRNLGVTGCGGRFLTDVQTNMETRWGNLAIRVPTFNVKDLRVLSGHKCIKAHGIFQKLKKKKNPRTF